jgi:hypothetical protein
MTKLLEAIHRVAQGAGGERVLTHECDYPLAYAEDGSELAAFVADIWSRNWIDVKGIDRMSSRCVLTVKGLDAIKRRRPIGFR